MALIDERLKKIKGLKWEEGCALLP